MNSTTDHMSQDDLIKFVTDPKTTARAVEASMEKRQAAISRPPNDVLRIANTRNLELIDKIGKKAEGSMDKRQKVLAPTDHTDGKPMTNYNERLDEIFYQYRDEYNAWQANPRGSGTNGIELQNRAKQAITSLIKELVIPARSGREYDLADPTGSPLGERVDNRRFKSGGTMDYIDGLNSGYNRAIDEFEQNLLKALEQL